MNECDDENRKLICLRLATIECNCYCVVSTPSSTPSAIPIGRCLILVDSGFTLHPNRLIVFILVSDRTNASPL